MKEELLRRCSGARAAVLHVAVDTESEEGCVYVRCASLDDAGRVFKVGPVGGAGRVASWRGEQGSGCTW